LPLTLSTGIVRLKVVNLKDQKVRGAHEHSAQTACEAAAAIRTVASLTREDDACRAYSHSLGKLASDKEEDLLTMDYRNAYAHYEQDCLVFERLFQLVPSFDLPNDVGWPLKPTSSRAKMFLQRLDLLVRITSDGRSWLGH
jgi:hypothetical protein